MRRTNKKEFKINQDPPKEFVLDKVPTGCAPCLKEALKIERQVNRRSLNEIKINEIKDIVRSIFKSSKNVTK